MTGIIYKQSNVLISVIWTFSNTVTLLCHYIFPQNCQMTGIRAATGALRCG